jgi:hypothetical protein
MKVRGTFATFTSGVWTLRTRTPFRRRRSLQLRSYTIEPTSSVTYTSSPQFEWLGFQRIRDLHTLVRGEENATR